MILHDDIIHNFVHDEPFDPNPYQVYPEPFTPSKIDSKRKDIVMELHSHILPVILEHEIFNIELLRKLVPNCDTVLSKIHIHLLVYAPKPYDIYQVSQDDVQHIYIDLLQIADQTPIVSRMVYILKHEISKICCNACMKKNESTKDYSMTLNEDAFYNGFAELFAWNEDVNNYNFQNTMYDEYKEKSFGMLYEAIQITDIDHQNDFLLYLEKATFWNRFTQISGMFYLYDIFHESGIDGMVTVYQSQAKHFIQNIFQL